MTLQIQTYTTGTPLFLEVPIFHREEAGVRLLEVGDAVYTARVMLDINPDEMCLQYDTTYYNAEPVRPPEDEELKMSIPNKNKTIATAINNKMSISPNPANDYFIVSYALDAAPINASLEIYDAMGKKMDIFSIVLAKAEKLINCSAYAKGMYHCILRNHGQIIASSKFNVTH